jgi:hypothetical protein
MLLLAWMVATSALAQIVSEPFAPNTLPPEDPNYPNGYIAGTALTDYRFNGLGSDSTGAFDIEDVGGAHGLTVKMTVDYTTDPMVGITTQTNDVLPWLGPNRQESQIYFSVDFQKGTATDGGFNNVWQVVFQNTLGQTLVQLQGGLEVARLRSVGSATISPFANQNIVFPGASGDWCTVGILQDTSVAYDPLYNPPAGDAAHNPANPVAGNANAWVYLNGVQFSSHSVADNGPLGVEDDPTNSPGIVRIIRNPRSPEPPSNNTGLMRFDNLTTAPGRPGDANHDRFIDIFDVNVVSANWNSPGGPLGDVNFDGNVDIFDVNLVSANWAPAPAVAAVPEPATWVLACLGLVGLAVVRRRRSC